MTSSKDLPDSTVPAAPTPAASSPTSRSHRRDLRPGEVPPSRYLLFVLIASVGCYLDLITKRLVFAWLGDPGQGKIWWLWENFIGIETSLNRGALFGLGRGGVLWFAAFSCVALVGVVVWFIWGRVGQSLSLTIVLACITAGILGNLYDRLGLWTVGPDGWPQDYAVRDWIRFSYYDHVWPNFNIADSLLVCGAIMLAAHSFWMPPQPNDRASEKAP